MKPATTFFSRDYVDLQDERSLYKACTTKHLSYIIHLHRVKRVQLACLDPLALKDLQDQRDLPVQRDSEEAMVLLVHLGILAAVSLLLVVLALELKGIKVKKGSR